MNLAGQAVIFVFEVVVFQVAEVVGHMIFPGANRFFPYHLVPAVNSDLAAQAFKIGADNQFRTDGTRTNLRGSQVWVSPVPDSIQRCGSVG